MSDMRTDEEMFRDLFAQAADRAPSAPSATLIGGARRKHRSHRIRQAGGAVAVVAVLGLVGGVVGTHVDAHGKARITPGTIAPAPTGPAPTGPAPTGPAPTGPAVSVPATATPEAYVVIPGGGTDSATQSHVQLFDATGKRTVLAIPLQNYETGTFTVGPSGKFVYWVSDAGSARNLWQLPVGGGDAVQVTTLPATTASPLVYVSDDDDSVAFSIDTGAAAKRFTGQPVGLSDSSMVPIGWKGAQVLLEYQAVPPAFFSADAATGEQTQYATGVAAGSACGHDQRPAAVLADGDVAQVDGGCSASDPATLHRIPAGGTGTTTPLTGVTKVQRVVPLSDGAVALVSSEPSTSCPVDPQVWLVTATGTVSSLGGNTNCD